MVNPKNKPNMTKFSQKYAQYAFSKRLKQQKCHEICKKSNLQNRNLQKTSKFELKQAQKYATRKSSKKPATSQKKQAQIRGKTARFKVATQKAKSLWQR